MRRNLKGILSSRAALFWRDVQYPQAPIVLSEKDMNIVHLAVIHNMAIVEPYVE